MFFFFPRRKKPSNTNKNREIIYPKECTVDSFNGRKKKKDEYLITTLAMNIEV